MAATGVTVEREENLRPSGRILVGGICHQAGLTKGEDKQGERRIIRKVIENM